MITNYYYYIINVTNNKAKIKISVFEFQSLNLDSKYNDS